MANKTFLQEKSALLTVLIDRLADVEKTLDDIEVLETGSSPSPDHDTLAISDLVSDAIELAMDLRDDIDGELNEAPTAPT
jgi:hypothetical protein